MGGMAKVIRHKAVRNDTTKIAVPAADTVNNLLVSESLTASTRISNGSGCPKSIDQQSVDLKGNCFFYYMGM